MTQGVAPYPKPWPQDGRLDPELLARGDSRNVEDRYRYWSEQAIRTDMQQRSIGLEIAIENLERDFNMGTIVRNANAFNVRRIHIIGRRQWNKRGAMKTDTYMEVMYHPSIDDFLRATEGSVRVAVDNLPGATEIHQASLPPNAVLIFGSEKDGISPELATATDMMIAIPQFGSTRSINVGVASGILIYKWVEKHILLTK